MKLTKNKALDISFFYKYNYDSNVNNELFLFEMTKHHLGHKDFRIFLGICNFCIFEVDFYNMKESYGK